MALVNHRPGLGKLVEVGGDEAKPSQAVVPDVPAELNEDEAVYWSRWAPLAQARGMLTEETVPGFVQLCGVSAEAAACLSSIRALGRFHETTIVSGDGQERYEFRSHPLYAHWRGLVQRQEQMLARFGLTADGKIAGEPKEKPDAEKAELAQLMAVR